MHSILQDLRYGVRQLRKSPSFTLTAILTLALGIGAATAIFSVVDSVLLKPLAYRDSGRLVVVWERVRFLQNLFPYTGANPRHARTWTEHNSVFTDLTLLQQGASGVGLGQRPPTSTSAESSPFPNLLDILGVQPILGRNFLLEECTRRPRERRHPLSWNLWQSLFHGDPGIIGKSIRVTDSPRQIVGVLPRGFYFPKSNELTASPQPVEMPQAEILSLARHRLQRLRTQQRLRRETT